MPISAAYDQLATEVNTIVEYALLGILVVVVSIVALQSLSSGLNSAMAMVKQNMRNHHLQANSALMAQKSAASGLSSMTGQGTQLSVAQQALLQQTLAQKLQTTGANGATQVLADQLAATAALLLAQGQIDQNQYDILMQLANQGHKMAQIEALISQAVTLSNGNYTAFSNMTFTFDGQSYTANELYAMLGYTDVYPRDFSNTSVLSSFTGTANPETANFLKLYNQAVSSGAFSNPLVQSTVTSAATQIASLSEVVEDSMHEYSLGNVSSPNSITAIEVSAASQMDSTAICTAGTFQDSGVLCSP